MPGNCISRKHIIFSMSPKTTSKLGWKRSSHGAPFRTMPNSISFRHAALAARGGGKVLSFFTRAPQRAFAAARTDVENAVPGDPGSGRTLGLIAMIDAGLGRRQGAVDEALRA